MYMHEGTDHGFHNDTPPRSDKTGTKLAWNRRMEFSDKYLRSKKS